MSEQRGCYGGTHLFDIVRGILSNGAVCLCGSLRTEYQHTGLTARWYSVPWPDGMSGDKFTWIGERIA